VPSLTFVPSRNFGLLLLPAYFAVTVLLGFLARRKQSTANAFLNSTHSLPTALVALSFLAANCGALELLGLNAVAAEYGVQSLHFYFIGAIPALLFLALWVMPVYRRSQIRSLPEFLEKRFGPKVRLLNACVVALTTLLLGGINLYALAQTLQAILGLPFLLGALVSAAVVLVYVFVGGLRATIYNEVFQLAVVLAGLLPLAFYSLRARNTLTFANTGLRGHLWSTTPVWSTHSAFDTMGLIFGLGFVLSFGYWCTDFVLMQRAFAARTDSGARLIPVLSGFGKIFFALIGVLPGIAAVALIPGLGKTVRYDQTLPLLMRQTYGPLMLGLGLTALSASLMSGFAANLSAFSALWTQDIYRTNLRPHRNEQHYLRMGRFSYLFAAAVGVLASYITFLFGNLMEHVQLLFSILASPFWAIFLLGVSTRRVTSRGAIAGFLTGAAVGLLHLLAASLGYLHYGSGMNLSFHGAIYSFSAALITALLTGYDRDSTPAPALLVFRNSVTAVRKDSRTLGVLATLLLAVALAVNVYLR